MPTTTLFEGNSATADANGRAVIRLGPHTAFEQWQVKRITIQSTSTTLIPTCKIYRGAEARTRLIDGTFTGTFDHSDTDLPLRTGEELVAVWETGDAGHVATLTVEGTKTRP